MSFQLFAMTGLFRNQQVAGSIPAGGSRNNRRLIKPEFRSWTVLGA